MKLVMTLLVRDEEDIVAATIDFHLECGVDFIIAMDNLSVDRTPEILRSYERSGVLHYILQTEDTYMQHSWVTSMARLASVRFGADWIINCDADEFWYPEENDLKQILGAIPDRYGAVAVQRTNFVPRRAQTDDFFADVMTVRERVSLNVLGHPLPPKVCHRAFSDIEIDQGNHCVRRSTAEVNTTSAPITILHFPIRSYRQLANKIALGGAAYARNASLPKDIGATWRHLYEISQKGELGAYFDSVAHDDADIERGVGEERFVYDDRLKLALAKNHGRHCSAE